MAIKNELKPILSINAYYLGDAPVYNYKEKTKEVANGVIYLRFACQMRHTFGDQINFLTSDQVKKMLENDDTQSSIQCKVKLENMHKVNGLVKGQKGVLSICPGAVEGKFYAEFVEWKATEGIQTPPPMAAKIN